MSGSEVISEKKKALLAYKQKLLSDIRNCEKRIDTVRLNHSQAVYVDEDSSDSDSGFPVPEDMGPSVKQLKVQSSTLSIRLQATQELTGLSVLESEVAILTSPPVLENVPAPTTEGTWYEVTAECRVDLVPFTITFYVHQPSAQFSPASYHELCVTAVKDAHAQELTRSVLAAAVRPSDAVQILRSYSAAQRSRRSSLARLAERYRGGLHMEALPDGGYMLKCADLLEISWTLTNKWSPIAPFHHRLKFDLEYMDEGYIRTIKQAHKQLMDPSLETTERTELLANIIDTCLEANKGLSSVQDSDGDPQMSPIKNPERPQKRRMSLEEPPQKKKDSEVMAPPKSLPKKVKRDVQLAFAKAGSVGKIVEGEKEKVMQVDAVSKSGKEAKRADLGTKNTDSAARKVIKNKTGGNMEDKENADDVAAKKSEALAKKSTAAANDGELLAKTIEIATKKDDKPKSAVAKKATETKTDVAKKSVKSSKESNKVAKLTTEVKKIAKVGTANENNKNVANKVQNDLNKAKKPIENAKTAVKSDTAKVVNEANVAKNTKTDVNTDENAIEKVKSSVMIKKTNALVTKKTTDQKKVIPTTKTATKKVITKTLSKPTHPNPTKVIPKPVESKDRIISGNVTGEFDKPKMVQKGIQKPLDEAKTRIPLPKTVVKKQFSKNIDMPVRTKIPQKLTSTQEKPKAFKNPVRMSPRSLQRPAGKTTSTFAKP